MYGTNQKETARLFLYPLLTFFKRPTLNPLHLRLSYSTTGRTNSSLPSNLVQREKKFPRHSGYKSSYFPPYAGPLDEGKLHLSE